jgi:hypothetical protein
MHPILLKTALVVLAVACAVAAVFCVSTGVRMIWTRRAYLTRNHAVEGVAAVRYGAQIMGFGIMVGMFSGVLLWCLTLF